MVKSFLRNQPTGIIRQVQAAAGHLAAVEIWPVAFLVVAGVVSARVLPVALGVAGLFWLIRWLACGRLSVRTPADWPLALLALMLAVTLWATTVPEMTLPAVYRLLSGIALYYAIVNWVTTFGRLRLLTTGAVLIGFLLALGALVSVDWSVYSKLPFVSRSLYARLPLLVSDAVNPNVMAGTLVILLPVALALLLFASRQLRWRSGLLVGGATLVMTGVLLLIYSRGSLMALGAALIGLALLRWRWGWLLLPATTLGGAAVVRALGGAAVLDILTADSTFGGVDNRVEIWSRAVLMVQDFPFSGVGLGTFQPAAETLYPFFQVTTGIPHAHNLLLQVAADIGIPGLIAWLAILMLVLIAAWQVYRQGRLRGDGWAAGLGAGLLCSQVALLVHGLVDAVTWGGVRSAVITWAIWGLAIAGWQVYNNGRNS